MEPALEQGEAFQHARTLAGQGEQYALGLAIKLHRVAEGATRCIQFLGRGSSCQRRHCDRVVLPEGITTRNVGKNWLELKMAVMPL